MRGFRSALAGLALALASLVTVHCGRSQAEGFEAGLEKFAADSYGETIAAIDLIVKSAAPPAAAVLEALSDGRLFFDAGSKSVFYKDSAGSLFDARSGGTAASAPSELSPVRLNNRVRSALQGALGNLGVLSADPARRRDAVAAILKSRDVAALPSLEAAIAKEPDTGIRSMMQTARASILLVKADAPLSHRLDAVDITARRGGHDALSVLKSLPADAPPELREAAKRAIASVEGNLALWGMAQNLWYGLSLGSVLLLAAIGLAITFGVMGVINMAHGEMVMLGAYTTFVVQEIVRAAAPGLFDFSLAVAIPLAFLVAAGVGIAVERGVIRFLYGRPLETLLATWGISLILQQAVRTVFGASNREVGSPGFMSGAFQLGALSITWNRLHIVAFAAVIFAALLLVLRATTLGLHMRAVTQNRRMAASMGIATGRVDALTFGLGSGIAGLAGVALSQIDNVSPNLGQSYIIDSFLVVVFGGVGNLWGTLVGALSLGIANKFLEPYVGAVLGKILLLVLIILFIQKRPRGLFALKGRAVEA